MEILIDFDGTVVTHDFPNVGKSIGAERVLKALTDNGHRLILFTMRSNLEEAPVVSKDECVHIQHEVKPGKYLDHAIDWFAANDIPLYGIQTNPTQHTWTSSPKAYAPLMIDDSALGCYLKKDLSLSHRPFVDWDLVEAALIEKGLL